VRRTSLAMAILLLFPSVGAAQLESLAISRVYWPFSPWGWHKIEPGKTKLDEVLKRFGEPTRKDSKKTEKAGTVRYYHWEGDEAPKEKVKDKTIALAKYLGVVVLEDGTINAVTIKPSATITLLDAFQIFGAMRYGRYLPTFRKTLNFNGGSVITSLDGKSIEWITFTKKKEPKPASLPDKKRKGPGPASLPVKKSYQVKVEEASVRGGPSKKAITIWFLKRGEVVSADRRKGDWLHISKDGSPGWIHGSDVE